MAYLLLSPSRRALVVFIGGTLLLGDLLLIKKNLENTNKRKKKKKPYADPSIIEDITLGSKASLGQLDRI